MTTLHAPNEKFIFEFLSGMSDLLFLRAGRVGRQALSIAIFVRFDLSTLRMRRDAAPRNECLPMGEMTRLNVPCLPLAGALFISLAQGGNYYIYDSIIRWNGFSLTTGFSAPLSDG